MRNTINSTTTNYSHVAVIGDFKYPKINWISSSTACNETSPEALFIENSLDCFLTQHVTKPTRARGDDTPSTLDLIFTNEPGMVSDICHNPPLDGSDHQVLIFDVHCYVQYDRPTNKFSYDKGNLDAIREQLRDCDWDTDGLDINAAWTKIADNLTAARDQHIPTYSPSRKPSWKSRPGSFTPDEATRKLIVIPN